MEQTRTAWQVVRYGTPEVLTRVSLPIEAPKPGEVRIRIHASGVSRADGMMRAGEPLWARPFLGFGKPRHDLTGTGFSGVVEATGDGVTRFQTGDAVFGEAGLNFGANASHITLAEDGVLVKKRETMPHEEAAVMCDGPMTSLNFLRSIGGLKGGDKVLILGASGALGSAAVQIARAMGAEVTGVTSGRNAEWVAELGATVVDYEGQAYSRLEARFDLVFDTLGVSSLGEARRVLAPGGRYLCPVLSLSLLGAMLRSRIFGGPRAYFSATGLLPARALRGMLADLLEIWAAGKLTPVMDRSYPLADLIEAHRYMETGRKRGNVVVV